MLTSFTRARFCRDIEGGTKYEVGIVELEEDECGGVRLKDEDDGLVLVTGTGSQPDG